jgi:hypothetical protein
MTAPLSEAELDAMEEPHGLGLAEQLLFLFEEEGLPLPPLPELLIPQLVVVRPWLFGSREDVSGAYDIEGLVREAIEDEPTDYVLFGQDGHGVNSVAMHYHLVSGPLALFVQVPWGGVYMDKAERNAAVAGAFADIGRLIEAVRRAEDRLAARNERLIVVASEWHGQRHAFVRPGEAPEWRRGPASLIAARTALEGLAL